MNHALSPQEKGLVEREFVAREQQKERRRRFRSRAFTVGILSGFLASALTVVFGGFFIPFIPKIIWIVCIFIYLDTDCLLPSFSKDMSPSWHMNPWKESLSRLSDTEDIIRGIALLTCFKISHLLFAFIAHLSK